MARAKAYACGCEVESPDSCAKCRARSALRARRQANPGGRHEESYRYLELHGDDANSRARLRYAADSSDKKEACKRHYRKDPTKHLARVSKWAKDNPELAKANYLKYQRTKGRFHRTGHSVSYYESRWAEQKGCCEICCLPFTAAGATKPAADHNHATGKPRAILCVKCNGGLGWLEHSLTGKMLAYLERWAARHSEEPSYEAVELQ